MRRSAFSDIAKPPKIQTITFEVKQSRKRDSEITSKRKMDKMNAFSLFLGVAVDGAGCFRFRALRRLDTAESL